MLALSLALSVTLALQADDRIQTVLALPQANALLNSRKYAEAKPIYEKFVRDNPYLGSQYWNLAQCELGLGEFAAAALHFENAAEGFSNPGECYFRAALCKANEKKPAEALSYLRKAADNGWSAYMDAIHNPAFKPMEGEAGYRTLVGLPPAGDFSRAQQWEYDLDFIREEAYRRHFNPYTKYSRAELDSFIDGLKRRAGSLSDEQMTVELYRYAVMLGAGHTTVMSSTFAGGHGVPVRNPLDATEFPLRFRWFPDGVYVVGATERYRAQLGGKLTAIDGKDLAAVWSKLDELIARDNDEWLKVVRPQHMKPITLNVLGVTKSADSCEMVIDGKPVKVDSQARGSKEVVEIEATGSPADYRRNPEQHYWFEARPGHVYLRYSACIEQPERPLGAFWDEVLKELDKDDSQRLVVDLRGNSGGNGHNVDALINGLAQRARFRQPRRIIALVDRLTYSASLRACGKLEEFGALFIGEPTGGRPNFIGELTPFILPFSKMGFAISDRYHQNAQAQDRRPFFAPRIVSELTFEDWRNNRDPGMRIVEAVIKAG